MNSKTHYGHRRVLALFLAAMTILSLFTLPAQAVQPAAYRDPADHWMSSANRTNELDVNAVVSHETFHCQECGKDSSFTVWRAPEYTTDGKTALLRNVMYSDGTTVDGKNTGSILDGTPGKDATYTGYHWTKSMCEACNAINSNTSVSLYGHGKNVYYLYDCSASFIEDLDDEITYTLADDVYHTKTVDGGHYCEFCFGTVHTHASSLERHNFSTKVLSQLDNQRFAVVKTCADCGYSETEYVAAKSVVADYYGKVDGQAHTLLVSDISEPGVKTQIRYGDSANSCTQVTPPSFTEEGQYTVYYATTYTYQNVSMTENGVAYVWLREETAKDTGHGTNGSHNSTIPVDSAEHQYAYLDTLYPTCTALGYDRYLCSVCGAIDKRNYVQATGHDYQTVVIREADCEHEGKTLKICRNCGDVQEIITPKTEHKYTTKTVPATCTTPGYTVKECSVCGDRTIINITSVLPHSFKETVVPATCTTGGRTIHTCEGCGETYVDKYTDALGHDWDAGTKITDATCNGEGVLEHHCSRCDASYLEAVSAKGHNPGPAATCTEDQLCKDCGAVLEKAHGHNYKDDVTAPTCTEMGYTTHTCKDCGSTYKSDYTNPKGHTPSDWIVDLAPTMDSEGRKHIECKDCGTILQTTILEKLYRSATTDSKGEAVVNGYLVIVTDTDTKNPIANAKVVLNEDGTISVILPDGRILDYGDLTSVSVYLTKDKTPVKNITIYVTDKNGNYAPDTTDQNGQVTVPGEDGQTGGEGNITVGGTDTENDPYTITVTVLDGRNNRPIEDATVTIGKTGTITVVLPDGLDMGPNNPIIIRVTDENGNPITDRVIIVRTDNGGKETGKTDEDGSLTVPETVRQEKHGVYIFGYPDGTFGPSRNMTRSEATAIFARLLAEKKGDTISESGNATTKFADIPANAWYAGYVKYLTGFGITYGIGGDKFSPSQPITRAEFVTMAVRFFEAYGDGAAQIMEQYADFSDVSSGYWAAEYIRDAAIHGWIKGYGDGTFRATQEITRAEVVTIVNRLLDRTADQSYIAENLRKLNTFTDMTEKHWAYYDVLESANSHTATYDSEEAWSK